MKKRSETDATLCANFCAYYKPGKNEELACEGLVVVRRLVEKGKKIPPAKRGAALANPLSADTLRNSVCMVCSFHESDCDFILTGGKAFPCGGFVVLSRLLDAGEITIEEIK